MGISITLIMIHVLHYCRLIARWALVHFKNILFFSNFNFEEKKRARVGEGQREKEGDIESEEVQALSCQHRV